MKRDAIASDLKRVDALQDEDIDYSDIPELDADFFRRARVVIPLRKQQLTIRLDADVLAWLKARVGATRAASTPSCVPTTKRTGTRLYRDVLRWRS